MGFLFKKLIRANWLSNLINWHSIGNPLAIQWQLANSWLAAWLGGGVLWLGLKAQDLGWRLGAGSCWLGIGGWRLGLWVNPVAIGK